MNSNKTTLVVIVGVILVLTGILVFLSQKDNGQKGEMSTQTQIETTPTTTTPSNNTTVETSPTETPSVKEITIVGDHFTFNPKEITVNKGDKIKLTFKNTQGYHNLMLDEFNVATKTINEGQQDVVEFVADKVGQFQYYCSVGNHRAMGMWGTLTVK